ITKREVLNKIHSDSDRNLGVDYILEKLNIDPKSVRKEDIDRLKSCVSSLRTRRNEKFRRANFMPDRFETQNSVWLDSEFQVPEVRVLQHFESQAGESSAGRRPLEFSEKSERSQRREAANISSQHDNDPHRILLSCKHAARKSGEKDLHMVLKELSRSPH